MKHLICLTVIIGLALCPASRADGKPKPTKMEVLQKMVAELPALKTPHGTHLPLFVWEAGDVPLADEAAAEQLLKDLDARGIAVYSSWNPAGGDKALADNIKFAKLQQKLGLIVAVNANSVLQNIYGGQKPEDVGHLDADGKPFMDNSQTFIQLGCPFRIEGRIEAIRKQTDAIVKAYKDAGVPIGFTFADFEFDGPLEWGKGWDCSKKCKVCREKIKDIEDFTAYQKAVREQRAKLQKQAYAEPILKASADALVGNYGVYPNDGFRYWFDFFEKDPPEGAPTKAEGKAKIRPWSQEFPLTGFTYAMPVEFIRFRAHEWYDFDNMDYRWFRSVMLTVNNAGKSAPAGTPVVAWVHSGMMDAPPKADPAIKPINDGKYQEFLFHAMMRHHDSFFCFASGLDAVGEMMLVQAVYGNAMEYRDYLEKGEVVSWDLPEKPGPVISAIKLGNSLLVRRTDFTDDKEPVTLKIGDKTISVPRADGKCQVIPLGDK
ncbi:MAG TPA: hypothetical protein VIL86_09435 [Tepidisphaeraceae bacterium]